MRNTPRRPANPASRATRIDDMLHGVAKVGEDLPPPARRPGVRRPRRGRDRAMVGVAAGGPSVPLSITGIGSRDDRIDRGEELIEGDRLQEVRLRAGGQHLRGEIRSASALTTITGVGPVSGPWRMARSNVGAAHLRRCRSRRIRAGRRSPDQVETRPPRIGRDELDASAPLQQALDELQIRLIVLHVAPFAGPAGRSRLQAQSGPRSQH
jgi:hypothetical protein